MSNKLLNSIIIYTILYIIIIKNKNIKKTSYKTIFNKPINKINECFTLPFINIFIAIISFILSYKFID
jgi:hypothetical protein